MKDFEYSSPTKIFFGKNAEDHLINEIKKFGNRVLLPIYEDKKICEYDFYKKILDLLKKEDIEITKLNGVKPNPILSLAKKGIEICREKKIDLILAIGGASIIDTAKCIAMGVFYKNDVWDFFENKSKPITALPLGVVLTIPAAGSEASMGAVITNENIKLKLGFDSEVIFPKFAILNPLFSVSLGDRQTFLGIVDIISHILERYFTSEKNVDLTDRLCESTLKSIIYNSRILQENPSDYNARAEIMLSGTIAQNNILGIGRVGDWSSHIIEHELSALYDVQHAEGLSIIITGWMRYVYKKNLNKFAQFTNRVFNPDCNFRSLEEVCLYGIDKFRDYLRDLRMPLKFSDLNIKDIDFDLIASRSVRDGSIGNITKLKKQDILIILESLR